MRSMQHSMNVLQLLLQSMPLAYKVLSLSSFFSHTGDASCVCCLYVLTVAVWLVKLMGKLLTLLRSQCLTAALCRFFNKLQ